MTKKTSSPKSPKKLGLDKRSLRQLALDDDDLRRAAGGGVESRGRGTVNG